MRAFAPSISRQPWRCPACLRCSPAAISSPTGLNRSPTRCGRSIRPRSMLQGARRLCDLHGAALSAAGRQGPLRRRSGRLVIATSVAAARDGAERLEIDYERAAVRHRHGRGGTPRCAAPVRRRRFERRGRRRARRSRRNRGRLRPRRACGDVRHLGPARHRRADGTARGGLRIRSGHRPLHALCRQRRRLAAQGRSCHDPRRAGRSRSASHARGRRQFRHPRHDLCRVRAGGLGGAARSGGR